MVQREVQSRVTVDSADAHAYFAKHQADLPKRPETYDLSAILIQIKPNEANKTRARQKVETVVERLKAGESFGRLATLFSDDPSANNEGLLRAPNGDHWFTRGTFDSTFEAAAFALKPGQTSGIVETRFGYHVIHVDSASGDRIIARHILVLVQPEAADTAAAREKAETVHSRAVAREDFGKLAQQFSDDPESRGQGGQLEPRTQEMLQRAFPPDEIQKITAMGAGQISPVLLSPSGFVVVRLNKKDPPRAYAYDEIVGDLQEMARQDKLKDEYDRWVAGLKKKHRVSVNYFS